MAINVSIKLTKSENFMTKIELLKKLIKLLRIFKNLSTKNISINLFMQK